MNKHRRVLTIMTLLLVRSAWCAVTVSGWSDVTALDQPLPRLSPDPSKAKATLKARLEAQREATSSFLRNSPASPHSYEAKVRIALAEARIASLDGNAPSVNEALRKLISLEKEAPDDGQAAETMFRRISLQWQNLGDTPDLRRENAITCAKLFADRFPGDRRAPRLLAEAASLCDNHPEEKERLIEAALALSKEEALTLRLKDDRKRIDFLGKPVDLKFRGVGGESFDSAALRGRVVAIVFWSAESAPSLVWMEYFLKFASSVPELSVATISLDRDEADLKAAMRSLPMTWPTYYDGKGWTNALARRFGINAIPTLWLLDRKGCLRALNARDNYEIRIRELLLSK
jgi:hypothetical protein